MCIRDSVYCAESEDNIQGQLEQMENIISKDYDAICAAPLSASNLVEGVLKACDAGIPVVNVDEGIDAEAVKEGGGNMVGMYTTDNVLVGQKAAEYITEQIGSGEMCIRDRHFIAVMIPWHWVRTKQL